MAWGAFCHEWRRSSWIWNSGFSCYTICSYLYGELQKSEMFDMIAFVDTDFTGALGCGNPTKRAKILSNRYKQGKPGQIFLVPYNNRYVDSIIWWCFAWNLASQYLNILVHVLLYIVKIGCWRRWFQVITWYT